VTAKPVVPCDLANRDIDDAIACYLSECAEQAAPDFIDAWHVLHGQRDIPAWMQAPEIP
jgi:plasmid stabilization system protein ParE